MTDPVQNVRGAGRDASGYWLLCKRHEHGHFKIFDRVGASRTCFELTSTDFALLLDGIDLRGARRGMPALLTGPFVQASRDRPREVHRGLAGQAVDDASLGDRIAHALGVGGGAALIAPSTSTRGAHPAQMDRPDAYGNPALWASARCARWSLPEQRASVRVDAARTSRSRPGGRGRLAI